MSGFKFYLKYREFFENIEIKIEYTKSTKLKT